MQRACVALAEQNGLLPLADEKVSEIKGVCERLIDGDIESAAYQISGSDKVLLRMKGTFVQVKRVKKIELEMQ